MASDTASNRVQVLDDDEILNYVADEDEVEEYAAHIGINVELDRDLLWIAREGLQAPPPAPWKVCFAEGANEVFYFNVTTGESIWDHPLDDLFRQKVLDETSKRVLVPLTLHVQASERGYALSCVNVAGNIACSAEIADMNVVSFADVEQSLLAELSLKGGAVPRFVLQDASVISHSCRGETLARLLKL